MTFMLSHGFRSHAASRAATVIVHCSECRMILPRSMTEDLSSTITHLGNVLYSQVPTHVGVPPSQQRITQLFS
jgi:hypothetical protein